MKKRGFRQQPLVSRPSEVAVLSSLLTQLTFYSYQALIQLSVLGLPMHIPRLMLLSALGYESQVHHLAR